MWINIQEVAWFIVEMSCSTVGMKAILLQRQTIATRKASEPASELRNQG
jgi:hypothetical protein